MTYKRNLNDFSDIKMELRNGTDMVSEQLSSWNNLQLNYPCRTMDYSKCSYREETTLSITLWKSWTKLLELIRNSLDYADRNVS